MGTARKADGRRRGLAWRIAPLAGAVVVLAAIGGITYAIVGGGSSKASNASDAASNSKAATVGISPLAKLAASSPADALAVSGLTGRQLLNPECDPIKGPRWSYPIGPPVPGLPNIVANIKSNLYEVFAINYSCKTANTWIRKFTKMHIPILHSGNSTVLKGPPGYYCTAYPDENGIAYAGGCQSKGGGSCVATKNPYGQQYANGRGCKLSGGNQAFGWNWNVVNRRVVFQTNDQGVTQLVHVSGSDTNVIFHYLKGKYQLQVLNTSGIGYLNGFTWVPSAGWKVTSIKSSNGMKCSLTAAGKIACAGTLDPPSCLCTNNGGLATITFTAAPTKKSAGFLFGSAAWQFKVTKMTPVPYIIPGAPDEAQKRSGV